MNGPIQSALAAASLASPPPIQPSANIPKQTASTPVAGKKMPADQRQVEARRKSRNGKHRKDQKRDAIGYLHRQKIGHRRENKQRGERSEKKIVNAPHTYTSIKLRLKNAKAAPKGGFPA